MAILLNLVKSIAVLCGAGGSAVERRTLNRSTMWSGWLSGRTPDSQSQYYVELVAQR